MKNTRVAIGHFLTWGFVYGLLLGAWSTTLMFPVLGTMYGAYWGVGIGVACGLLCGVIVSVVQAWTFHDDVNVEAYSRRLSLGIGLLVGIVAPVMLIVSSRSILWGDFSSSGSLYFVPSLLAVTFWGSLSAAYAAHGYPPHLARAIMNHAEPRNQRWDTLTIMSALLRKSFIALVLLMGGFVGGVIHSSNFYRYPMNNTSALTEGLEGGIAGVIVAFILMLLVVFGTAIFLMFFKRVVFSEDGLFSVSHTQQMILTVAGGVFTGLICACPFILYSGPYPRVPEAVIGVAICALLMSVYTYQAFPLYDKDKRKAAEDLQEERAA